MIRFPNAKINLGLHITEKRQDGYHNLETIFYPIGLKDALEIIPMHNYDMADTEKGYRLDQSGISLQGDEEHNLVIKALKLITQERSIPPIEIHLLKKIPFGAGLGGGSSDAAAMLQLLNDRFSLGYSKMELAERASKLGADCPFFIYNQPALATGIGDILEPIALSLNHLTFVLVKPNISISTAKAYSMITPTKPDRSLRDVIDMPLSEWKNYLTNDFEPVVFKDYPEIQRIKQQLYEKGACYASMSGSGSSVFGLFDGEPDLNGLFENHFVWMNK